MAAFLAVHPSRAANALHGSGVSDVGWPIDIWANWDGAWYTSIAAHGYQREFSPAFFPLYPYLSHGLAWVLGGHVVLATMLVSLAACALSFVLLYRLTSRIAGPAVAKRAVLYLAIFPTALFLQASYAESLFLALAITTFLLAERGRLGWAGVACGLTMLTRPAGVAVLLALVVFALRRHEWRRGALAAALAVAIVSSYPLMLWWMKGDPLAFAAAQEHWGRHFTPAGPLLAALEGAALAVTMIARLFGVGPAAAGSLDFQRQGLDALLALFALVVFVALLNAVYRRFGARSPYFVYALVSLAIPLFSPPDHGNLLLSLPRLGLMIFPFFIALAMSARRQRLPHLAYVAASTMLLAIASVAFALFGWVA